MYTGRKSAVPNDQLFNCVVGYPTTFERENTCAIFRSTVFKLMLGKISHNYCNYDN